MPVEPTFARRAAEPGATAREQTRRRVVDAAMDLLERGGRDAVAERGFTRPGSQGAARIRAVREAMVTTVTTREPAIQEQGAAGAARALRAALPSQNALSEAEEQLLAEWLRRLSAQPFARGGAASRVNEPDDANAPAFPPMLALARPAGPWTSGRRSRPPGHGQHTAVGAVGKEPRP
ncbi:hypothetical protein ACFYZ3_17245 [Streptomyces sp. NPDC001599]|uniref:hypothetical protein n=1 Tax=Streptomyces sp. NPDC001599 TaxID=3364591 RepID=UPI0036C9533A